MSPFFKAAGHREPEDPRNGIFQFAFQTEKEAFEAWHMAPEVMDNFNVFMTGVRGSRTSWVDWWPVEALVLHDAVDDDDSVILVDIAGGVGHDIQALKRKFPKQRGRYILEDLPVVIDSIKQLDEGIERVKYDFFTPQTVKGKYIVEMNSSGGVF